VADPSIKAFLSIGGRAKKLFNTAFFEVNRYTSDFWVYIPVKI